MPANIVTNADMFLAQMSSGVSHTVTKVSIFVIAGLVVGTLVTIVLKDWMLSKGMTRRTAVGIANGVYTLIMFVALVLCVMSLAKAPPPP